VHRKAVDVCLRVRKNTLRVRKNTLRVRKNTLRVRKNALRVRKTHWESEKTHWESEKHTESQKKHIESQKKHIESQKKTHWESEKTHWESEKTHWESEETHIYTVWGNADFLVVFVKLRKPTFSFSIFLSLSLRSVCLHRTTRLPQDGYSWNLVSVYFSEIRLGEVSLKSDYSNGYFTWRQTYIYYHISLNSS